MKQNEKCKFHSLSKDRKKGLNKRGAAVLILFKPTSTYLEIFSFEHLKGHCHGHFGQSAQMFYKEHGLNMNCSYKSEKKILRFFSLKERTVISF